ncbi:alpha/beta fold hydrolase [Sphingomonas sp.]|jgi:polyhydroxyalkanoate synthase|uniref:PHA/PHB synthase family protein n=1 Tax=Sphingomonas sp. TaxID=28214 RepID=UPI0026352048|nr:alpha/beta fold hydrolase [Sphingomonas sp.]MDF2494807.1 class poly(R)-hydroxyalkanoic acid synthase [Sphingomonas sp.]
MTDSPVPPSFADLQQWTAMIGRAQQMMLEQSVAVLDGSAGNAAADGTPPRDPWADSMAAWQQFIAASLPPEQQQPSSDKRFTAPAWQQNPFFATLRQAYEFMADQLMRSVETMPGADDKQRAQMRFAMRNFVDALSPTNFPFTNPQVIERTLQTRGDNLRKGLQHMLADIARGQMTHTPHDAFELGRNLATTPGKVVLRTPLYELIHYTPTTPQVLETPLVIFPPWINRFYILDLSEEKSFIRWCLDQGISVFMVSWKSADASMKEVGWRDYIAAQIGAIDTVRDLLDVPAVHAIGYCVAGTTLAATLALLAARREAAKVASATFFTAQVDFTRAGDLATLITDDVLDRIDALSPEGFLDGRYMATTFNMLRSRDLVWNYVTNNYLLGEDYAPFDLLHWNGDVTNLPARWHRSYLADLYRDNLLVKPGAITIDGTPLDLGAVQTPAFVQAGREDHIAPADSVWEITRHFRGPVRFVLAGSGHIAGVVNPPAARKYRYWTNDQPTGSFAEFVEGAIENAGSWWPEWLSWLRSHGTTMVDAVGARIPGQGKLPALDDAPGRYVRER